MPPRDRPIEELVNQGFVTLHDDAAAPATGAGQTLIVTGPYRSGTSLVASLLREIGICMGDEINDIVHEDEAFARAIEGRDRPALRRLIASRNATYGTWGFKLPMLSEWLRPADLRLFHQPRLLVTCRDPVAIALRNVLSEYREPAPAIAKAADDSAAIIRFVAQAACPALLLSYEKALVLPAAFITAVLRFCGLPQSDALRERLIRLIEPNRPGYIAGSRRRYEGRIEGVIDGRLHGWCRLSGDDEAVMLDVLVDGRRVLGLLADGFRPDLRAAGFGSGRHGFSLDLPRLQAPADAVLRIRVAGQEIELENSGKPIHAYLG